MLDPDLGTQQLQLQLSDLREEQEAILIPTMALNGLLRLEEILPSLPVLRDIKISKHQDNQPAQRHKKGLRQGRAHLMHGRA